MLTPLERVNNLLADLRYAQVDFDTLFSGRNNLTPLESVELFLAEQQRLRILKQNLLRRKRANLPAEKTLIVDLHTSGKRFTILLLIK